MWPMTSTHSGITLPHLTSNSFSGKRQYLTDYKQLTDVPYLYAQSKNILVKSFLLQGILSTNKYTKHMEREIAACENNQTIEPFDEDKAKDEFVTESKILLIRNIWNLLTRKFYERILVNTLDIRLADRLTKDMFKSTLRKLQKFTPAEAARRAFWSGLYSGVVPALALFTVDCGYGLHGIYLNKDRRGWALKGQCMSGLRWVTRRLGFHGVVAISSAVGVACGARLNTLPKYSTLLICALCEVVGGEVYNWAVGSLISAV